MGIINLTEDSFFDGGTLSSDVDILRLAEKHLSEGAAILDLGAASSRPGAAVMSAKSEIKKLLPATQLIVKKFPEAIISIDTMHSKVASVCADNGVSIINDISGGTHDPEMAACCSKHQLAVILMHMKGKPSNMQSQAQYDDVLIEITQFLQERVRTFRDLGVKDIVIDPGFGFGKNDTHNYTMLKHLDFFRVIGCPVMVGVSRKSMIQRQLNCSAHDALNGTTAAHIIALEKGAQLLRVHDVRAAMESISIFEASREPELWT